MYFISVCSRHDRYDSLRLCIGEELHSKLANLKLFMVRNLSCLFVFFFISFSVRRKEMYLSLHTSQKKVPSFFKVGVRKNEIGWSVSC